MDHSPETTKIQPPTNPTIRLAYGSLPKESGTFTFYRNHRSALRDLGVEVFCVAIGAEQSRLWNEVFADDHCIRLAPHEHGLLQQARAFVDWCREQTIDVVMPVNSPGMLAAVPHLPPQVRVVSRCANALPEGYEFASANLSRISNVVALTPRLRDDLAGDYGVPESMIELIPNGVDTSRFQHPRAHGDADAPLRLGFLGRLEHKQKGVLYLPEIVRLLNQQGISFELSIAGTGVHEAELRRELASEIEAGQVQLVGLLSGQQVPRFLAQIDLYLFLSHFEGCPNALLEAMAAGCVPMSWTIPGITDFLIEHRRTGCLVTSGDCQAMVREIATLADAPAHRESLSQAAAHEAQQRFSLEQCARRYQEVLQQAMAGRPQDLSVRPWDRFQTPPRFVRRLGWLPEPIRNLIKWAGRRGRSAPTR